MDTTTPVRFSEVRAGMKFKKTINNRLDPRWGQSVTLTVTEVSDQGSGMLAVWGESQELDYLGNPYGGGPGGYADSILDVLIDAPARN